MTYIPNFITLAGLASGLFGIWLFPSIEGCGLMLMSIGLGIVDGATARLAGTVSTVGASLDWHCDVALSYCAAIYILHSPALCAGLALTQALTFTRGKRFSGRTVTFIWAGLSLVMR